MNGQNHVSTAPAPAPLTEFQANGLAAFSHLVYRGNGTVIIAGAHFRQVYVFSPKEPEQWVEAEDVDGLLRTGLFLIRR